LFLENKDSFLLQSVNNAVDNPTIKEFIENTNNHFADAIDDLKT